MVDDDYGYLYSSGDASEMVKKDNPEDIGGPEPLSPLRSPTRHRHVDNQDQANGRGGKSYVQVAETMFPPLQSKNIPPKDTPQRAKSGRQNIKTVFPRARNDKVGSEKEISVGSPLSSPRTSQPSTRPMFLDPVNHVNSQPSSTTTTTTTTKPSDKLRIPPRESELYGDPNARWFDTTATSTSVSDADDTMRGRPPRLGGERVISIANGTRGMLGETLTTLYLVSGLTKDPKTWSISDPDAIKGVQPLEDSLGYFWRPDVLGKTFSGNTSSEPRNPKASVSTFGDRYPSRVSQKSLVNASEESAAMSKMISIALKLSHPREVEIVNASLAPPSMTHCFTFELAPVEGQARGRSTDPFARAGNYSTMPGRGNGPTSRAFTQEAYGHGSGTKKVTWYGVCLTVWNHADEDRAKRLKAFKQKLKAKAVGGAMSYSMDGLNLLAGSTTTLEAIPPGSSNRLDAGNTGQPRRGNAAWRAMSGPSDYISASEDGHASESDMDASGVKRRAKNNIGVSQLRASTVATDINEDAEAMFEEGEDLYWIPYALTLVSRYPIYDCMSDFLKLSWARFSKNVKAHSLQIYRILNYPTPRPGETIRLSSGQPGGEALELSCVMPGALVFQRGMIQNFQIWPLFQVLSVANVLTCLEVALSSFGRVVFVSRYPAMLGVAVETMRYMVSLRGWNGIALPLLHARDMSVLIEDPGPYLIGINSESRNCVVPPPEALVVDLDVDNAGFDGKLEPDGVLSYRATREKYKKRLLASYGPTYSPDHNVPATLKFSYPGGKMRPSCNIDMGIWQPVFLGEVTRTPSWFDASLIVEALDKILVDKGKKPSFMTRILGSGPKKTSPSPGEISANLALRTRALHYIETRDTLESKFGQLQRRLLRMVQEGEVWKKRFEQFEKYADQLGNEAQQLKARIETERREAKTLCGVLTETTQQKAGLQQKLEQTEEAHKVAMRQLSDMHQSIQEIERERDEMMAAIESQIEGVFSASIQDDLSDIESQPSSPRSEYTTTSQGGRGRSGTVGTVGTINSRATATTTATATPRATPAKKSVIDAAANRRSINRFSAQTRGTNQDDKMTIKSKEMADRMSLIQQKLDMALQAVTMHRRNSLAFDVESQDEEADVINSGDAADNIKISQMHDPAHPVSSTGHNLLDRQDITADPSLNSYEPHKETSGECYSSTTHIELPVSSHHPGASSRHHQNGKTVRRSSSQTVLATITTVVQVNDDRDSHREPTQGRTQSRNRAHSRSNGNTNNTHGGSTVSRVSLVPVIDENSNPALSVSVGDEGEGTDAATKTSPESESGGHEVEHMNSTSKERVKTQRRRGTITEVAK